MSKKLKPKNSASDELLSKCTHDEVPLDNNYYNNSFQSPCEIFRNNTTAVEVIVKEIKHKGKRQIITSTDTKLNAEGATLRRLDEDIKKLKSELNEANSNLEEAQRCFEVILFEMKKQLQVANQRELQTQTKNLALQLEKEKLVTLLDSKSKVLAKLKKEFTAMRRILKFVMNRIRCASPRPGTVYNSDVEYNEFERDLRNSAFIMVTGNSLDSEIDFERIVASKSD